MIYNNLAITKGGIVAMLAINCLLSHATWESLECFKSLKIHNFDQSALFSNDSGAAESRNSSAHCF
jgi:hypothetical protein